jgi:hypothetical protein
MAEAAVTDIEVKGFSRDKLNAPKEGEIISL